MYVTFYVMAECIGVKCKYYHKYYIEQKYKGAFMPNFELPPDEFCTHPSVCDNPGRLGELGVRIPSLKICPKSVRPH